jgi:transcriptional regulator with XRE-family HTH domain
MLVWLTVYSSARIRQRDEAGHTLDDRELGQRIAYWRRRRGLTQEIFADRLGRSKSWVEKVERGARSAGKLATLDLICEVLRIDLASLIGEEPKRRAAICLTDAEVERIQSALERYPLQPRDDPPPDLTAVRRQLEHAWTAFEFADYDIVSLVLPGLIEDAQHTHSAQEDEPSGQVLTEVYQIAASTLRKLGEHSLAWLAGDRGIALAQHNGNTASVVATGFRIANALLSMGRSQQAQTLNVSLAESLQPETHGEAERALYGHVLMQAAIAAATTGDHAAVRDLTIEAAEAARYVSPGSNHYRLAFNATNVLLHQVNALLALGEGGRAIEVAAEIDEEHLRMLRRERRAALLVDIARAYSQIGSRDEAVRKLVEAETVACREVRCRPVAQATIADLLRRSRNAPPLGLAQLAERSGVHI